MSDFVLDTSVVVKWFSAAGEADLAAAVRLRDEIIAGRHHIIVPDLLFFELANALRYNPHFQPDDVKLAMASVRDMDFSVRSADLEMIDKGVEIAFACGVTVYDAIFLALAEMEGARCITVDHALSRKAASSAHLLKLHELYG